MEHSEEATRQLLMVLPLINRIVSTEVRAQAGEETTMPQFRVLAHLSEGPMTLSALARKRRVSLQSIGELVQALVERGWITRRPDSNDRRQMHLYLTDAGRQHYERAQEYTLRRLTPIIARLSDEELRAVQVALPALHRVFTQVDNEE